MTLSETLSETRFFYAGRGLLFKDFFVVFSRLFLSYSNIIINADLNCNSSSSNFEATHLRELVSSYALSIVPSGPTHHISTADSWLDVFIMDSPNEVVSFCKPDIPFIAGHDLLELAYQFDSVPN